MNREKSLVEEWWEDHETAITMVLGFFAIMGLLGLMFLVL